jgi:hypothetical protein
MIEKEINEKSCLKVGKDGTFQMKEPLRCAIRRSEGLSIDAPPTRQSFNQGLRPVLVQKIIRTNPRRKRHAKVESFAQPP